MQVVTDPNNAVSGADVVVTDTWVSMGQETEKAERLKVFESYRVDSAMMALAKSDAIFMHCLPAYRGKEITEETLEAHADTIFREAENRLHTQKAIVDWMVG